MGLNGKHTARDLKIPEHRQTMLKKIEQDLLSDDNILAVFYGGSIAVGSTDIYSDIDLRIVVEAEAFEQYRYNKRERAKNWGRVLYFEDFPQTAYSIAHYDTFIKVDTFYYKTADLKPSIWLQDIDIIYDRTGYVTEILEESNQLIYKPTVQEVEIWRTKFFAYVHEAYRRIQRKELYYALQCLDSMRLSMAAAWYMDKGLQPNTFGDWAKYEGNRSRLNDGQLALLAGWHPGRDAHDIMAVIENIIPEFKKAHRNLCEKTGLNEDPDWLDEILRMV